MKSIKSGITLFVFAALSFTLAGCEAVNSLKKIEMPDMGLSKALSSPATSGGLNESAECPQVKALDDLSSISQFADSKTTAANKLVAVSNLSSLNSTCKVADNSVTVELSLDFSGTLGPVGVKDLNGQANYTYPYFLSVITPSGQILSKDVFALSMVYENGQINVLKQDKLRQVIPLGAGQTANQFQVVVGFQLSEEELAYNRSRKAVENAR